MSHIAQLRVLVWVRPEALSALGLAQEAPDPADQGLDEGVAGADTAVQRLHLQQLPLQSLSEGSSHVALQLQSKGTSR